METLGFEILICILAGAGAGIGTGFAGLSAAVFISPMLVAFLDVPFYEAVGIALASDVVASAVSAYTYRKEGNIDIKGAKPLMLSVLVFTILGSFVAYLICANEVGGSIMGYWSIIASLLLGLKFIVKPSGTKKKEKKPKTKSQAAVETMFGAYIGSICGFQGAGGGLMILFTLTEVMKYEFKKAVGTSVFIMAFTAFIGAASHFAINGMPDYLLLFICVVTTTVFARGAAVLANKISVRKLNLATGAMLTVSGIFMLFAHIFL